MYFRSKLLKTTKVLMLILISVCLYNLGFAKQYLPLGTGNLHFYNEIPFKTGLDLRVERTDFSFISTYSMDLSGTTDLIPSQFHRYRSIPKAPVKQYHIIPA